ncbi:MAG: hypothetical protein JWM86_820 [Thermoleophilia bacterium]|nr:hypothetical protein [Thermoleophilia bacterium]
MPILPSIGTRLGAGWGRYLAKAPLAGHDFGDVLAEQVRFRIIRAGATSIDDVRPDSRAARTLWKHPETRQVVQGVLDLANSVSGSGGASPLRGFTLSTTEAGYVANRAVHHFRDGTPTRDAFEAGLAAARSHVHETAAVRKGAWLHLDPARSAGLLHMLRNPGTELAELSPHTRDSLGRGVKTLLHELNHVSSPRPHGAARLDWLSEANAETLARWPGQVRRAGETLGIPVPARVGRWFDDEGRPYQEEVDALRGLLRLAGIDTSRIGSFSRAERLLNGTPEDRLPAKLAKLIADRHTTNVADERALARRIERIIVKEIAPDGSNARARPVEALRAELEGRHVVRFRHD